MSEYSLKERVQMLTSSLVYGGPMTFEQIKKLDWLKNTSEVFTNSCYSILCKQ